MAETPEPPRPPLTFKPKEFERVNVAPPGDPAPPANDIFALQRELREREIAAGMDVLKPADRPRATRRRRDYFLLLATGNAAIVGISALVGFNLITLVYAFSGVVLYTVGLTWLMWFVMGDY